MINRRDFIKSAITAAMLCQFSPSLLFASEERFLKLFNTHTHESLELTYFTDGSYDHEALKEINYFLRCHYTNEVKEIDVNAIDLIHQVQTFTGSRRTVKIVSGYRSPEYNAYLIKKGRGVARKSLHLEGKAIDFRIEGMKNRNIANLVKSFKAGGVGLYRKFVHADVGRVRYW